MLSRIGRNYRELKYLAYHDSLTRLLNRNWLYKNIDSINCRYVYFIDINNLKNINKRGHTFGDNHILEIVADIQSRLYSPKDRFMRYAGDEFIVFTNEDYRFSLETRETYSVGMCKVVGNVNAAIQKADENMIISKEKLKNKK